MAENNKQVGKKLQTEIGNKFRTSSGYLGLNKHYIKSTRKLVKIADGKIEATKAEIEALEALIRCMLPYDPFFTKAAL
jgi:hypothetical protein